MRGHAFVNIHGCVLGPSTGHDLADAADFREAPIPNHPDRLASVGVGPDVKDMILQRGRRQAVPWRIGFKPWVPGIRVVDGQVKFAVVVHLVTVLQVPADDPLPLRILLRRRASKVDRPRWWLDVPNFPLLLLGDRPEQHLEGRPREQRDPAVRAIIFKLCRQRNAKAKQVDPAVKCPREEVGLHPVVVRHGQRRTHIDSKESVADLQSANRAKPK